MANPITRGSHTSDQSIYEEFIVADHSDLVRAQGLHPVGTRGFLDDGRVFYYARVGTTATVYGQLCTTVTLGHANHDDILLTTPTPAVAGSKVILINGTEITTTDAIANLYQDGYVWVNDADGEGQYHKIRKHDAFDAGSTNDEEVHLYDPLVTSLAATSQVSFAHNPYDGVTVTGTAEEDLTVGVALFTPSAASGALNSDVNDTTPATISTTFQWIQTWGPCAVKAEDTTTQTLQGMPVIASTTAGAAMAAVGSAHTSNQATVDLFIGIIGNVLHPRIDTETMLVDLKIRA